MGRRSLGLLVGEVGVLLEQMVPMTCLLAWADVPCGVVPLLRLYAMRPRERCYSCFDYLTNVGSAFCSRMANCLFLAICGLDLFFSFG